MSFWNSISGDTVIDGSEKNSHAHIFTNIPDGTTASASIKTAEINDTFGLKLYQIIYKLIDGEFKNREVRQNIKCFDEDPKKRDRSVNMLMRLFKICNTSLSHSNEPSNEDLMPCIGKVVGIKINEWFYDGKEGNYVSEIHPVDSNFIIETGIKTEHNYVASKVPVSNHDVDSALSRNRVRKESSLNENDIPF